MFVSREDQQALLLPTATDAYSAKALNYGMVPGVGMPRTEALAWRWLGRSLAGRGGNSVNKVYLEKTTI